MENEEEIIEVEENDNELEEPEEDDEPEEEEINEVEDVMLDNIDNILSKKHINDPLPEEGFYNEEQMERQKEFQNECELEAIMSKMRKPARPYKPPKPPKERKLKSNKDREKEIHELIALTSQLGMDKEKYNVAYFNSMSDAEMIQFKLDLFNTVDNKMAVLSKDSHFVTNVILRMADVTEKVLPKYFKGYKHSLEGAEQDINRCLDDMIAKGELENIMKSKFMSPKYQLMMILGGTMISQVSKNMNEAKNELKGEIKSMSEPFIDDIKKKAVLPSIVSSQHVPLSRDTFF